MVRSLGHVAEYYMADPKRAFEAQTAYATQFINLWAATLQRFQGGLAKPLAGAGAARTSGSPTRSGATIRSSTSSSRPTC